MKKNILVLSLLLFISACSGSLENRGIENGVSLSLAQSRKARLSDINYQLEFRIPDVVDQPIQGIEKLSFILGDVSEDLLLDFRESKDKLKGIIVNDKSSEIDFVNEHIIINKDLLRRGKNIIEFNFFAGESSLNRNEDFLYTLFVPDRARTAFPCFDQPNLKATYELTLDLPASWTAIANGPLAILSVKDGRKNIQFEKSDLISTYLFSFVAGEFKAITKNVNGREMTMLHRETDTVKVNRNADLAFYLHDASLRWLEDYTAIPYPFKKLDFALIPSFQYGGMEHVGAIQYQANSILLDEDPSQSQLLSRASLIAHETAHMWFGDLVTMDWFNDVWTKEVFANFMAAKMVNPSFPDIDHDLNFLVRHYPSAYAVDRTEGANPIRQELNNLNEAGQMYGPIIYNKAPIMMRQLEMLIGAKTFQEGMQEYLKTFAHGNATWPDLVKILDRKSPQDLLKWSEVWVNTPGRPEFELEIIRGQRELNQVKFNQVDPYGLDRIWPQGTAAAAWLNDTKVYKKVISDKTQVDIDLPIEKLADMVLSADGRGYGLFQVDMNMIQPKYGRLTDLEKGAAFVNLYENFLEGKTQRINYIETIKWVILREKNELILNLVLGQLNTIYWSFLTDEERVQIAPDLERLLYHCMETVADSPSTKKIFFNIFRNLTITENNVSRLYDIWSENGAVTVQDLNLSENDKVALAAQLAIRLPNKADEIVAQQLAAIKNPDTKRRFEFVSPALSSSIDKRDAFFESLKNEENRQTESWVLAGLSYLHHPLRRAESEKYLKPSLALLKEIQETGDIFFPSRWLGQTLENYNSASAVKVVRDFLSQNPNYNAQLKMKVLQSADQLFRAEKILSKVTQLKQSK
ncbi:MAG: peptidase M1 [Cytophagales bacterium CG12_big_fil_rev_8_21_14_0_65_40_12]|nr:MAG: peptidase M1 [Cytophagales bacterium CG12_big_fil_rev_8_21_14_0_65_40_12]PIW03671.1 MAG: peptidase M1 [Cytophagales bacterium CG17_big_fil_post_rev_8_21_14_2_50_40_13]